MEGNILWQKGKGGIQPYRPGPVAVYDIDNDGQSEVVCFFHDGETDADPFSLKGITIQIIDEQERSKNNTVPMNLMNIQGKVLIGYINGFL